jgi:UDP-N-acetyl-2-amino-2-deoxyglucuronate dehydrogenase
MSARRFALIGCGRIGERHAENIVAKAKLAAVCDINKERADSFSGKYQVSAYYTLEDLLGNETDIDVAVICTPNGLHAKHSISCLNRGTHVLCEKPMALNLADCVAMTDAARQSNRLLSVVKQNRFNPPVAAVKMMLDEGKLGKVMSVQLNCFWNREAAYYKSSDWKGTKDMDGGILFTQFSHFIDLLYWMIGDVKTAHALTGNFIHQDVIDFEDTGVVILQFVNGPIGSIHYTINSHKKNMEGSLTIFGEKGTVKIGGEYLNKLEYQNIDGCIIEVDESRKANDYGSYSGSMSNHDQIYDQLLFVLENGGSLYASAEEGLKTVEIIERIKAGLL